MQLGEVLAFTLETDGNRTSQLQALRRNKGLAQAWITRPSYSVLHLGLAAEQARKNLEAVGKPGLFFAGRAAGSCNYTEAAAPVLSRESMRLITRAMVPRAGICHLVIHLLVGFSIESLIRI